MADIVERLNEIAISKVGPWGEPMAVIATETARDAIAEIMRLRTTLANLQGVVTGITAADSQSFAEIKQGLRK